jgi:hypothetical protein
MGSYLHIVHHEGWMVSGHSLNFHFPTTKGSSIYRVISLDLSEFTNCNEQGLMKKQ